MELFTKYDSDGALIITVCNSEYNNDSKKRGLAIVMWEDIEGGFQFSIVEKMRNGEKIDIFLSSVKEFAVQSLKKIKNNIKMNE